MPYNPTVPYRGDINIRGLGDSIRGLFQNFMQAKEEQRGLDQVGQYMARQMQNDPDAVEQFGEDWAKYPSMSNTQKKALIGTSAAYLANKKSKAEGEALERWSRAYMSPPQTMAKNRLGYAMSVAPEVAGSPHFPNLLAQLRLHDQMLGGRELPKPQGDYEALPTPEGGWEWKKTGQTGSDQAPAAPAGYQAVQVNGKWQLVKRDLDAEQEIDRRNKRALEEYNALVRERTENATALQGGDERTSWDWAGWGTQRATKQTELDSKIAALQAANPWLSTGQLPAAQGSGTPTQPAPAGPGPLAGKFREGATVQGKDGRLYTVVNGYPVPK